MRQFKKIAALLMAIAVCLGAFAGCNVVSKNNDRDLSQVITTVQIESGAPVKTIYKRDMAFTYLMSDSWQKVYNGESTRSSEMETIYNSLLKRAIIYQVALKDLNSADESYGFIKNSDKGVWEAERYLSDEDIEEIYYNVNKSFNDSIDSYVEDDDDELKKDTSTAEVRTAPTGAENETKVLKYADWYAYNHDSESLYEKGVNAGFKKDPVTGAISLNSDPKAREKRDAYNTLLKSLDTSGILAKNGKTFDFNNDTIYDSFYYDYSLEAQTQSKIIEIWENYKSVEIMKEYTYEQVCDFYATDVYEVQKANYGSDVSAYATALENASKSDPVVYHPYAGYGYVYNLLLGVDDTQNSQIELLSSSLSTTERSLARNSILSRTTATDLRSTWITEGYDSTFDSTTGTVTFINDYSYNKADDKLSFKGVVDWNNYLPIADRPDDYENDAYVKSLTVFSLNDFVSELETWIYGAGQADDTTISAESVDYYKVVNSAAVVANWDQKVKDALFAFSTDGGSLSSTYKGYLVKPNVDPSESETYVAEFQMAAKKVLELGGSSYAMVATDYGYHMVFYSESIAQGTEYATLASYLNVAAAEYDTFKMDNVSYTGMEDYFAQVLGRTVTVGSITDDDWSAFYTYMINNSDKFADGDLSDFYLYTLQQGKANYFDSKLTDLEETLIYGYMYDDNGKPVNTYVKIYEGRFSDYFEFKYLDKNAEE